MIRRRSVLMAMGAGLLMGQAKSLLAEDMILPPHTRYEDGHFTETWFLESFLDLREDAREAQTSGKALVTVWEQRGCPGCRKMHLVNFADDGIRGYIQEHFTLLQLDLFGARQVTDFDGTVVEERELARRHGVRGTPTLQFYPREGGLANGPARELEVARLPGYLEPEPFLAFFRYVQTGAYKTRAFPDYLKSQST